MKNFCINSPDFICFCGNNEKFCTSANFPNLPRASIIFAKIFVTFLLFRRHFLQKCNENFRFNPTGYVPYSEQNRFYCAVPCLGVSALVYAFHLASLHPTRPVFPLLNIPAVDYPLRNTFRSNVARGCLRGEGNSRKFTYRSRYRYRTLSIVRGTGTFHSS